MMISIRGKRILVVGKETFMYPFYYLLDAWEKDNIVAAFWTNPHESEYTKCDLNSSTYYEFKKRGIKAYSLTEAVREYEIKRNLSVDYDEVKKLEDEYSYFKGFNQQIISDQMMSVCYHTRDFNNPPSYEQQLIWLTCIYENIEQILDDYSPDVIFDCDIAELPRTVLNEVAHKRRIPYISIAYSKYELYKIPSYTLNLGVEKYFFDEYERVLEEGKFDDSYVTEFKTQHSIKNPMYFVQGDSTYAYKVEPLIETLKTIFDRAWYFKKQNDSKVNRTLRENSPEVFVNPRKYMIFWKNTRMFRRWLYQTKDFFDNPTEGEQYVYMPLHLVPESTTFSISPFWINELSTIEAVSKALPAGWYLYVKEHQAMLGERSMEFYKQVKKIPNAKLVRFNYYDDPKPWIDNARAVVTITGTAAYEAVLLGKPAFVFGDVPFSIIKGVTRIRSTESLPQMFKEIRDGGTVENTKECAAYLQTIRNLGREIDLKTIMNKAYLHLTRGDVLDDQFMREVDNLRLFFEDAYNHADERMNKGTIEV